MIRILLILLLSVFSLWGTNPKLSWYSWNGFSTYKQQQSSFFMQLPPTHRIFLSFNVDEIIQLKNNIYIRAQLNELLQEAKKRKIIVELLLGDAAYVYPRHRKTLLALIKYFEQFPFQGIQLDIEPWGLAKNERRIWYQEIAPLIEEVKQNTNLPVGLSIHHGVVNKELLQKLKDSGLDEVIIMYYSINTHTVLQKLFKLMHENKNLHFSLALSIEPLTLLKKDETYAIYGQQKALKIWRKITKQLASYNNFSDLVIQSLEAFKKAKK